MDNHSSVPLNHLKLKVAIVLLPNFTLLAMSCLTEVLRHAADDGDKSRQIECSWDLFSISLSPVASSSGISVIPNKTLGSNLSDYDYIAIIGGKLESDYNYPEPYIRFIRECHRKGHKIIGMCTGTFALARAGIMNNVRTALHWYHYQEYKNIFESSIPITDELFIDDRGIISCVGGAASSDLALYLVEKHLNKNKVIKCLRHLILITARKSRQSQTPFDEDIPRFSDIRMRKAIFLMEQNIDTPMDISELADELLISKRQLSRLFMDNTKISPAVYYRNLRLRHARWILENTEQSLEQVALICGFSDLSHLTRCYKKQYGETPGMTRKTKEDNKNKEIECDVKNMVELMHE